METTPTPETGECRDCGALLDDEYHRAGCPSQDTRGSSHRKVSWS